MDDGWSQERVDSGLDASTAALRSLTQRVSELEQQVAELRAGNVRALVAELPTHPQIAVPLPPPPPPRETPAPASPQRSLEDRLGSQLFNFIGILAILFGASWALKLAIDHGLLGPSARVILGLLAGSAVILWSEHFRRRGVPAFSYTLKAIGSSLLYLSLWAGFQLFHLFPGAVALVAMVLVTAWNAYMAWSQEAELLAFYALLGALLTPVLLSTGADHEGFLFTYLALIDLGAVLLLRVQPWPRLLVPALLGTAAYFAGYYGTFFHALPGTTGAWDAQSTETAVFAMVFTSIFALVTTKLWISDGGHNQAVLTPVLGPVLLPVLLPLGNAAFAGCALAAVFEDSGLHAAIPWVMVGLAAIFLGLVRLQQTSLAAATHLAAAVVLMTVAIPLKASGHTLTSAWLVEGLALFWLSCTLRSETSAKCRALTLLSGICYALGLGSLVVHWTLNWSRDWTGQANRPFLTANLGSALVAVVTLGGATWLALPRTGNTTRPANLRVLLVSLLAIDAVAVLLALGELLSSYSLLRGAFANADFARTLISLMLFAATARTAWRIAYPSTGPAPHPRQTKLFRLLTEVDVVVFNLLTLFSLVRETSALWTQASDSVQRSLAISGVLMAYAALLLGVGFWRQQAFVRWQALVLILFTIAKVFLYDISGLSAGYRVASFLALGALLLAVSFAYQKDWLSLRPHAAAASQGEPT